MSFIDRRTFVQRTGLAGLSMLAAGLGSQRAFADPDPAPGSVPPAAPGGLADPEIFPFQLGGTDAYVIHDGTLPFPSVQPAFAPEGKPAEVEELLKKNFLATDHFVVSLNILVVKSKSGVMLFDAGPGKAFGPASGRFLRGLARIGVAPQDVKSIYITHAHPDHIAGLLDESNALVFPSARIIIAKSEVDFWTADAPDVSRMRTPPDATTQMLGMIQKLLGALKPNLDLKEPGTLTPEVELIAGPGHTPGHSLFRLTQGDEKLLVFGDAVHSFALQFPRPEWTMMYDVDPAVAVKTRTKQFKDAAAARTTLMVFHLPFPGIGHVRTAGSGYEWVPRPWVV